MRQSLVLCLALLFVLPEVLDACIVGTPPPSICRANGYDSSQDFDWTTPTYDFWQAGNSNNPRQLASPFYELPSTNNLNTRFFSENADKDFDFADGWRYVTHSFGTSSNEINNPYLVLYNVHSSILRVFVAVDNVENQNNQAVITINWSSNSRSAALEHYNGEDYAHALDGFIGDPLGQVPNHFVNTFNPPYWLHADFNMNYDPCTCLYSSQLFIQALLITSSDLEFTIQGSILQEIDDHGRDGAAGTHAKFKDRLSGFNSAYKDGKTGIDIFKKIFKEDDAGGSSSNSVLNTFGDIANFMGGAGSLISAGFKLIGLFTGTKKAPAPKVTPLVFKADLKASGNLVTEFPYRDVILQTPGSSSTIVEGFIPYYNEVMGTFNLLKTPRVKRTVHKYTQLLEGKTRIGETHYYELVDDPLEYVVNPRTGIQMGNVNNFIRVAYDYVNYAGTHNSTEATGIQCFDTFRPGFTFGSGLPPFDFPTVVDSLPNPDSIYVKIIALFHDFQGDPIPYVCRYKLDIVETENRFDYPGDGNLRGTVFTCPGDRFYPPANNERISQFCASEDYRKQSGNIKEDPPRSYEKSGAGNRVMVPSTPIDIQVFPNPTQGYGTVRYTCQTVGNLRIVLRDIHGRVVSELLNATAHEPGTFEIGLNTSGLVPGLYLLGVENNGISTYKKVQVN